METMEDVYPRTSQDSEHLVFSSNAEDQRRGDDEEEEADEEVPSSFSNSRRTLGVMYGVFAPVSLSMFSTLLFLRVGYIVANAGIFMSMLQLVVAYLIICLTVCSVSAIATNGAIEGGGVYFMISRTLGPELGGTIGTIFYFANVVGSALFATGCAEGIVNNFGPEGTLYQLVPGSHWWQFLYASTINLINLAITLTGAHLFGKVSVAILFLVTICSFEVGLSFTWYNSVTIQFNETMPNCTTNCSYHLLNGTFDGLTSKAWRGVTEMLSENGGSQYFQDCEDHEAPVSFSSVFAVLFSGVTGIMAGANLSGELKKPSKAIPYGTFSACAFTFCTYAILFLFTGLTCNRTLLYSDCHYMSELSLSGFFVAFGAIMTTFFASTSGLIGASRVLQAVAKDTLLGPLSLIFTKGTTSHGNPYAAVFITWLLIQMVFLIGSFNQIAKLDSILFLMSYLSINAACFTLDWASATNFRPTFNAPWYVSLLGVLSTAVMIFMVDPMYGGIGIFLASVILLIFHFVPPAEGRNWGSVAQGILFHQVRKYLLFLDSRKAHVKFWRPQVLLLISNPQNSCNIIDFANSLKKGGLYILGHVFTGDLDQMSSDPTVGAVSQWLNLIDQLKVKAFPELTLSTNLRTGIQHLIRLSGIGAMKPNTVFIGFRSRLSANDRERDQFVTTSYANEELDMNIPMHEEDDKTHLNAKELCSIIRDVLKLDKNVCLHRNFQRLDYSYWFPPPRRFPTFMTDYRRGRQSNNIFFDVWLFDFFSAGNTVLTNRSGQFMLQLACIITMVKKWKSAKVRVLIRVQSEVEEREMIEKLRVHLAGVRIKALIEPIKLNPPPSMSLPSEGEVTNSSRDRKRGFDITTISDDYMRFLNRRIRDESAHTVVSFFQLNPPPVGNEERFVELLEILSNDVPPCLFIHGIQETLVF